MKKYLHYLLSILLLSSCVNQAYRNFDYNTSKNPWIDAFKDQVFFASIKESYRNDTMIFKMIEKKGALNPYDGLSLDALNKATELGRQLVKNMPPPAMCDECKEGDNYYMAHALHYYTSLELNNIAREEYKKHLKRSKAKL